MDYGERIAKLEAVVESHKEQLNRIEQELVRLRVRTDEGFAALHGEMVTSLRWQIRLTITLFIAVVGMFMAVLGMLAKLGGVL